MSGRDVQQPIVRRRPRFIPYDGDTDRPLCRSELVDAAGAVQAVTCGENTQRRAVFFDRYRQQPLCATCAVHRILSLEMLLFRLTEQRR